MSAATGPKRTRHPGLAPRSPAPVRAATATAVACLMVTGLACREPTELMVQIESDLVIPDELDGVRLRTFGAGGSQNVITYPLRGPDDAAPAKGQPPTYTLPILVGLVPDGESGPFDVQVTALKGGMPTGVQQTWTTEFLDQDPRVLPVFLEFACKGKTCMADETCAAGECVVRTVDPKTLPKYR